MGLVDLNLVLISSKSNNWYSCYGIHFMSLMKEVTSIFGINPPKLEVFCKFFKEKKIYIAVAEYKNISPKTKHIDINYHHLRSFIHNKIIWICYIDTQEQISDIFANPLDEKLFLYLQRKLSEW